MFIATSRRLRVLNVSLILALLSQLLSGCPSQVLELWCLEPPRPCYRTVVRRWRRPLREAPFHYQLGWLIRWLVRTWPHWLVRCGLLLALLLWKGAACPPLAWGLLAGPPLEVLCLGLGFLCRSSRWPCGIRHVLPQTLQKRHIPQGWRRRWWILARWLGRGYGGVLLLLLIPQSARYTTPLLLGSLMAPSHQGRPDAPQLEVETAEGARTWWIVPCQVAASMEEQPGGEWLFPSTGSGHRSGAGPAVGSIQLVQDEVALRLLVRGVLVLEVPHSDRTGQRWLVQLLLRQGLLSPEEAADLLGLSRRTVQRDQAAYEQERDSACLVDRRRFNPSTGSGQAWGSAPLTRWQST